MRRPIKKKKKRNLVTPGPRLTAGEKFERKRDSELNWRFYHFPRLFSPSVFYAILKKAYRQLLRRNNVKAYVRGEPNFTLSVSPPPSPHLFYLELSPIPPSSFFPLYSTSFFFFFFSPLPLSLLRSHAWSKSCRRSHRDRYMQVTCHKTSESYNTKTDIRINTVSNKLRLKCNYTLDTI